MSFSVSIGAQKPVVRDMRQLALFDQALEGLLDEVLAFADVVEELTPEDEEAGVDPEIERRHVLHVRRLMGFVERDDVEVVSRAGGEEEPDVVARFERLDHLGERRVREAVPVGGEEHLVVVEVRLHLLQALADDGVEPGVDERDRPVVDVALEQLDPLAAVARARSRSRAPRCR